MCGSAFLTIAQMMQTHLWMDKDACLLIVEENSALSVLVFWNVHKYEGQISFDGDSAKFMTSPQPIFLFTAEMCLNLKFMR